MKKKWLLFGLIILVQFIVAQTAPVANNDTFTVSNSNVVLLPLLSNDFDIDGDPLTVTILIPPVNGIASTSGGQVNYSSNLAYIGTDSFTYIICDTTNRCDTAVVFLNIIEGNAKPVAVNDNYIVFEDASTSLPVASNDFDPEGDGLTVTILVPPVNGTVTVSSMDEVIYTSNPFYFGIDSFVYVICDSQNGCDTGVVYIIIEGVDSPPLAQSDTYVFNDTVTTVLLDVLMNDSDPENDTLYLSSIVSLDTISRIGSIDIDSMTGLLLFIRNDFSCGSNTFQYSVCDRSSCDTAQITININCPSKVFLPQGFSPGSDGKNDKLVFIGIEYFAPVLFKVFNRYGTIVYESEDYKNDWDGTYIENGKPLPDGTYFYILELADRRKYKNYVVISR